MHTTAPKKDPTGLTNPGAPRPTQKAIRNHPLVDDLYREEDDCNGFRWNWWCHLKPGWIIPHMDCGTAHEPHLKRIAELVGTARYEGE